MGRIQAGPRPDILYFHKETLKKARKGSPLKTFLYFLKGQKSPSPIRFSFIDSEGSLLPNLSLKENISLDSVSANVSSVKNFTLEDYLERNTNKDLVKLYNSIQLPNDLPPRVDSRTRKTAALVKGLLQKSDFLFLDSPEKYLDQETLTTFISALLKGLHENGQTLLLHSEQPKLWLPYITKTVCERTCERTGKILLTVNNRVALVSDQSHSFSEIEEEGEMVFNMPEEHEDKSAA